MKLDRLGNGTMAGFDPDHGNSDQAALSLAQI
jgi:hypothetical protein